jgi:hypothetical protein
LWFNNDEGFSEFRIQIRNTQHIEVIA